MTFFKISKDFGQKGWVICFFSAYKSEKMSSIPVEKWEYDNCINITNCYDVVIFYQNRYLLNI